MTILQRPPAPIVPQLRRISGCLRSFAGCLAPHGLQQPLLPQGAIAA